jgi:hypothetical protein
MTETKALILVSAAMIALACLSGAVLALVSADGIAYGLTIGLLAALGGFVSSQVVMHYGALKERREREEILLR